MPRTPPINERVKRILGARPGGNGTHPPPLKVAQPDGDPDPLDDPPEVRGRVAAEARRTAATEGDAREPGPAPAPAVKTARLATRALAEIDARPVRWLWPARVPYGMLSMLDGDPSHGKSLITLDLAARVSRGWPMPFADGPAPDPAGVLVVAAEDTAEQTIKPRCVAAGADERLVRVSECIRIGEHERPIRFPDDFDLLERELVALRIGLLVIDPLLGFLSQSVDSHKDQSVRDVLHQLKLVAERTGAAVVGLRHLSKGGGGNALYRGLGSIAITAAARAVLAVDSHPNGEAGARVLAVAKCNLVELPRSATYRIETEGGQPVIRWGELCDLTANDLGPKFGAARGGDGGALAEAVEFLRDLLAAGPVPAADVKVRAENAGIKDRTLNRAKVALKIATRKMGFSSSTWVWELPGCPGGPTAEGCQVPD